jgi:hypothetical protein
MADPLGCWWQVRQRPPPKVGPLGVLVACPTTTTTEVEDVDGRPPGAVGLAAATTEVEDVDGGPPRCARAGGPEAPTMNAKKC